MNYNPTWNPQWPKGSTVKVEEEKFTIIDGTLMRTRVVKYSPKNQSHPDPANRGQNLNG